MLRHLHPLRPMFERARERREPLCGALLMRREGPSYRPPGVWMLADRAGNTCGLVSAGCLEAELAATAQLVLAEGHPRRVIMDTSAEGPRGWSLGCGGRLEFGLFPLGPDNDYQPLADLLTAERETILACDPATPHLALLSPGEAPPDGWLALTYRPPPRLLLCGSGPDLPPMKALIRRQGWRVTSLDDRPAPGDGDGHEVVPPAALAERLAALRPDGALVMSHHLLRDQLYLEHLTPLLDDGRLRWLGLIGARRRCTDLLSAAGLDPAHPRIDAPAGLDLGAHDPEALAVAVVARLLQVFPDEGEGHAD